MVFEPLVGWRWVKVTERRTAKDLAEVLRELVEMHDQARKLVLVTDNLNTHGSGCLCEAFEPEQTRRLAEKLAARATVTRDDLRVAERVAALGEAGFPEVGVSPARTGPAPDLLLRGADWGVYLQEMIRAADEEVSRLRAVGASAGWRFSNFGIALKEIHRGTCRPLPCGAAYGYVSVNAEGDYYTCHRTLDDTRFELGPSAGPAFAKRLRFLEERHVDRQLPCRGCWARYLCGGGCHAEVASAGRAGCDMIRGWLEHCLRLYDIILDEFPPLFASQTEPCVP